MSETALVDHVVTLLNGEGAHQNFRLTVQGWPEALRGKCPEGTPHTAWQLLEHMRIAQWDILEFSRSSKHLSPRFPDGYWPETTAPPEPAAWEQCVEAFERDLEGMKELVARCPDPFARIPWGDGQTILREALVLADHNAYHLGQLVLLRRQLGIGSRG